LSIFGWISCWKKIAPNGIYVQYSP
jgi:hypothetical protein